MRNALTSVALISFVLLADSRPATAQNVGNPTILDAVNRVQSSLNQLQSSVSLIDSSVQGIDALKTALASFRAPSTLSGKGARLTRASHRRSMSRPWVIWPRARRSTSAASRSQSRCKSSIRSAQWPRTFRPASCRLEGSLEAETAAAISTTANLRSSTNQGRHSRRHDGVLEHGVQADGDRRIATPSRMACRRTRSEGRPTDAHQIRRVELVATLGVREPARKPHEKVETWSGVITSCGNPAELDAATCRCPLSYRTIPQSF